MIFDRIMLPAQGRNEDYKFAQTGSVTLVASVGGSGGGAPTPSWLENVIKVDPESGFLSVDNWHVKGSLIIEGQVNQWLAQQLVVDDARIQVNRKQDGAVADSGLVIYDKDTSDEVSSLVYDINGIWKAGGDRLFTEAYNPKLGGYAASSYPRKDEAAVITGAWKHTSDSKIGLGSVLAVTNEEASSEPTGAGLYLGRTIGNRGVLLSTTSASFGQVPVLQFRLWQADTSSYSNMPVVASLNNAGSLRLGSDQAANERLHVTGNGLFDGNIRLAAGTSRTIFLPSTRIRDNNGKIMIFSGEKDGQFIFRPDGDLSTVNQTMINDLGLSTPGLSVSGTSTLTGNVTAGGQLSSPTYVSGFAGSGWRIDGGAETQLTVDRLTVRQRMDVYELVVNQIRGTNGALWVSDSAKVASVSGNRLTIDTGGDTSFVPFVVNDLLRCQRWNGKNIKYYVVRVTAVGSNYIDVTLVNGSSPREAGDHLVRMGNTEDTDRQGALYLTSSDSNAPYMDVLDGVNSASFAGKTKVRIGRLDGITDPDLGTLSGYGLYTENGYFKGKITVTGGNAATKADVDAALAAAEGYTDTLKGRVEDTLGLAALESINETLITGGKIRTSLLEVTDIVAAGITAGHVEGLTLNFDKGKIGDFEIFKNPAVSSLSTGTTNMRTTPYDATAEGMALYTQGTDKRIVVKVAGDNYVDMRQGPYGWGLYGVKDGATVFRLGSTNQIAGINFDDSKLSTSNWELNKDGSFYFGAGGEIEGSLITGVIESQNWDGENGSRLNLIDGSLEFGNTIKVDSFAKEIIVKDGATQNTGVRIGDFLLSPTTGGAGALDVDLSGSRIVNPGIGYDLRSDFTYINGSGVIGSSSVTVSTSLSSGNSYTFQTDINARINRRSVVDTNTDPVGAPSSVTNSLLAGDVKPLITVSLFSGATKVGEQRFNPIATQPGEGTGTTYADQTLSVNIPFVADSNSLRVEITQSGEAIWKVRYPASYDGGLVELRKVDLVYSELNTSSRVRIVPSAAINELSAKGFLSLWGADKYFRIYDRVGVTNFIEARGTQVFISPNGNYRLRISDSGIEKKVGSGAWTPL